MAGFRNISIQRKLIAIIVLTSTLSLMLACAAFLAFESISYRQNAARQLSTLARVVADGSTAALAFEDRRAASELLSALRASEYLAAACIYTKDGRPFAVYLRGLSRRDLPRQPGAAGAQFQNRRLEMYQPIILDGENIGTLYLNRSLDDMYARLKRYAAIAGGVWLVLTLAALGLSSLLQRVISEPLLGLANVAGRVSAERDYSLRAAKRGNDEIGALADSFNGMMEQIQTRTLDLDEAQTALERHLAELSEEIGRRKRAQEEAVAARQAAEESSRAKSLFLASMSHELRTPLNTIIGYSEMLRENAEVARDQRTIADLERITSAGRHLLSLINDVLDLSKVEAGKAELLWEEVSTARILGDARDAIAPLAQKNGNRLVMDCAPDIASVEVDAVKFRQSLYNLLSNACKFTRNGTVKLEVAPAADGGVEAVEWRVSDTGIGIAADQLPKLFQAFSQGDSSTTRQYGGTGLGLAISQRFCRLMGGQITVESELGKGSTFTIHLPRRAPIGADLECPGLDPATLPSRSRRSASEPRALASGMPDGILEPLSAPAMRTSRGEPAPRAGTILAIDDDPAMRDQMARLLAREGFQVVDAANGPEALRLARELRPEAITLDVFMPGMDGWSVLSALKADPELAEIPVVMLTIAEDRRRAALLGAAEFLRKPVQPERLVEALRGGRAQRLDGPVLVVDDDRNSREMAVRIVRQRLGDVMEADSGQAALASMAKRKPALILLDLNMPGMDGFEFIAALRQVAAWRAIPIVVLTSQEVTAGDRQRLSTTVRRILKKGDFPPMGLACEIADLLNGRPLAPDGESMKCRC